MEIDSSRHSRDHRINSQDQRRAAYACRSINTSDTDELLHRTRVDFSITVGQARERPGLPRQSEVADRDEGVLIKNGGIPFQDIDDADHRGHVEVVANDDGTGGGTMSPAVAGIAFVVGGKISRSIAFLKDRQITENPACLPILPSLGCSPWRRRVF